MKLEKTVGPAVVTTLLLAVIIGAASSPPPGPSVEPDDLAAVQITYAGSGRMVRITSQRELWSIGQWLDVAFKHPRSRFDLRKLPPPDNTLEVEFESGELRAIEFSLGRGWIEGKTDGGPRWHDSDVIVLRFEGRTYIAEKLPGSFDAPAPPEPAPEPEEVVDDADDFDDL